MEKTAEEIIAAFNAICDTLKGRELAVKIQTLLIRSPRGLGLVNDFLTYSAERKKRHGDDEKLYDCASTGAFEYLIDEIEAQCGDLNHDERFNLYCFLSSMK